MLTQRYQSSRELPAKDLRRAALVLLIAVLVGTSSSSPSVMTPANLQTQLVTSGPWTGGGIASDASCVAAQVSSNGAGTYRCLVTFTDGHTSSYQVTVGNNGDWVTNNGR
jgi:hypothetical protein